MSSVSVNKIQMFLLLTLTLLWASASSLAQSPGTATPLAECRIGKGARLIEVPVSIQDKNLTFIVDTGAAYTCFDRRHSDLLGRAIRLVNIATPDEKTRALQYRCPPTRWIGLEIPEDVEVITSDLAPIRMATGRPIDGILGMDVLHQYAIEIDFDSGRLRVWNPEDISRQQTGNTIEMSLNKDHLPYISMNGPHGPKSDCLVDTGANLSTLTSEDAQHWHENRDYQYFQSGNLAASATGLSRSRSGRISELKLADHVLRKIRFDISELNTLGLNILSRFSLLLDFPNRKLTLDPGNLFDRQDHPATSGLAALWMENQLVVVNVQPGSGAAAAGVQREDIIRQIDTKSVSDLDYQDVAELLTSNAGRRIKLVVERNKEAAVCNVLLAPRATFESDELMQHQIR
jgi:predicted aspartyl protease